MLGISFQMVGGNDKLRVGNGTLLLKMQLGHGSQLEVETAYWKGREAKEETQKSAESAAVGYYGKSQVFSFFGNLESTMPGMDSHSGKLLEKGRADAGQKVQAAFAETGLPSFLGLPRASGGIHFFPFCGVQIPRLLIRHPLVQKCEVAEWNLTVVEGDRRCAKGSAQFRSPDERDIVVPEFFSEEFSLRFPVKTQIASGWVVGFFVGVASSMAVSNEENFHFFEKLYEIESDFLDGLRVLKRFRRRGDIGRKG
jgi:hypothetical protein